MLREVIAIRPRQAIVRELLDVGVRCDAIETTVEVVVVARFATEVSGGAHEMSPTVMLVPPDLRKTDDRATLME